MAKAPKTPAETATIDKPGIETPTPAVPAPPPVKKIGRFEFATQIVPELPEIVPTKGVRPPAENPFNDFFDLKLDRAHRFIPTEYWLAPVEDGGRGASERFEAGKFKGKPRNMWAYAKQKIREAFAKWQEKNDPKVTWALVLVDRKAGDANGEFPDAGVSMFLVAKVKPPVSDPHMP